MKCPVCSKEHEPVKHPNEPGRSVLYCPDYKGKAVLTFDAPQAEKPEAKEKPQNA